MPLLGIAVVALAFEGVGFSVLRTSICRDPQRGGRLRLPAGTRGLGDGPLIRVGVIAMAFALVVTLVGHPCRGGAYRAAPHHYQDDLLLPLPQTSAVAQYGKKQP